jgi:hypothetical protein
MIFLIFFKKRRTGEKSSPLRLQKKDCKKQDVRRLKAWRKEEGFRLEEEERKEEGKKEQEGRKERKERRKE